MTKLYRKCNFDVREKDIILCAASLISERRKRRRKPHVTVMKMIGREYAHGDCAAAKNVALIVNCIARSRVREKLLARVLA